MGGGGSIGMMNATIKNNRKLLKKRKGLMHLYRDGIYVGDKTKCDFPDSSPKITQKIIKRLQSERRHRDIIRILVFGLVLSSVIVALTTI